MKRNINELNAKLEMQYIKDKSEELCQRKNPYSKISYNINMELILIEQAIDDILKDNSISIERKVKKILLVRDRCRNVYDAMRYEHQKYSYDLFSKVKDMKCAIEYLANDYLKTIPECFFITTLEDTVIENEEVKEIKTNISGSNECLVNDIIFYGHFPTTGYLEPNCSYDSETGMHINVKNIVPKIVEEEYDTCGYHYCDEEMTRYISPGIYRIDKDKTIGVYVKTLK